MRNVRRGNFKLPRQAFVCSIFKIKTGNMYYTLDVGPSQSATFQIKYYDILNMQTVVKNSATRGEFYVNFCGK